MEQKLKESSLLSGFKENNITNYKRVSHRVYEIQYLFTIDGIEFSIISGEQYSKGYKLYTKSQYGCDGTIAYGPMGEIYCKDVDNSIDRAYDNELNKFNKYIKECLDKKGK